jgi:hypothetical protein
MTAYGLFLIACLIGSTLAVLACIIREALR